MAFSESKKGLYILLYIPLEVERRQLSLIQLRRQISISTNQRVSLIYGNKTSNKVHPGKLPVLVVNDKNIHFGSDGLLVIMEQD